MIDVEMDNNEGCACERDGVHCFRTVNKSYLLVNGREETFSSLRSEGLVGNISIPVRDACKVQTGLFSV